ncbi:MAG: hypothetical protein KKA25_04080 [Alphaproteobacteria bacterium]|nr:hypothetical protein [Alphaproteobacteria bacterium]
MVAMTRQALFEAAWERPLTEIAEDIGITSTGLKKICDRHDIPTPGRGYWAQVRAGKTFPLPRLRPAKSAALEQVHIQGARALPPVVAAAIQTARDAASPRPRARRARALPTPTATPEEPDGDVAPPRLEAGGAPDAAASPLPKVFEPTRKAIARARLDDAGFASASGARVVSLKVGRDAQGAALDFLARLVEAAETRGWRLDLTDGGAQLMVENEPIKFRVEEQPAKAPHQPTAKELTRKRERDRWGGDSQPWPTWDLSPSGRLSLMIEEHPYSGLRRTFSQRKGYPFADSLDAILIGFAGHAALKLARRLEAEARAKAAAIAEARRERLAAFDHREKRRTEFAAAIGARLSERAPLQAVLDHITGSPEAAAGQVPGMVEWLRRRLQAIEAQVGPNALEISARHAEVDFREPPQAKPASRWYSPKIELHLWVPAEGEGRVNGVSELEWAIAEGLVMDPSAAPGEGDEPGC